MKKVEDYIRGIPNFPELGIIFRDVTTILRDADELQLAVDEILGMLKDADSDVVISLEFRGFIFGVPVAYAAHKGFIPVRKKGKLPCEMASMEYGLECGSAVIETHKDAIKPGQEVATADDSTATGGAIEATTKLIEGLGGEAVKICLVVELAGLKGKEKLSGYDVNSIITYEGN